VKIADIIQFRQALSFLNTAFPFSLAFGAADTREACITSSEKVFYRLLSNDKDGDYTLRFDTLALLAVQADGNLDEAKLTELVRLFRPNREGILSLVDFAKSIDAVYKNIRLLRANVNNSSRLDGAFERMFHVFFYAILVCICLAILGINPLVLFASISGFILGFSFMIGSACSKIVEGVLLILVRRPYDIGDRIAVSDINSDTDPSGSAGWTVKGRCSTVVNVAGHSSHGFLTFVCLFVLRYIDINLFTTTVLYGSSNEVATYSNGSLAGSR
jgi:small-conductance mechanosensitive channel